MTIEKPETLARSMALADDSDDRSPAEVSAYYMLEGIRARDEQIAAALREALSGVTITASAVEVDGERLYRVSRDPLPALRRLLAELGGEGEPDHVHAYVLESMPPRCACGAVEPSPSSTDSEPDRIEAMAIEALAAWCDSANELRTPWASLTHDERFGWRASVRRVLEMTKVPR